MNPSIQHLCKFLDASPSVYHAVSFLEEMLVSSGYTRLHLGERWSLAPGGKYYLTRGGSAVIAFRIPEGEARGFAISASHADRPCFKLKENPELPGTYTRLAVERYGGMLMAPWLDRPLSIAGRALVREGDSLRTQLIDLNRDAALIPNMPIHFNREVNDGYKFNPQVDLLPLLGGENADYNWRV